MPSIKQIEAARLTDHTFIDVLVLYPLLFTWWHWWHYKSIVTFSIKIARTLKVRSNVAAERVNVGAFGKGLARKLVKALKTSRGVKRIGRSRSSWRRIYSD